MAPPPEALLKAAGVTDEPTFCATAAQVRDADPTRRRPFDRAKRLWLVSRRYLSEELLALALEDQGDEARGEVADLQAA